uniref:(northern house mosquito) hypothetical protein n=1 Tax=Culex pipiens TaxID=7175 RepID=A0A8D8C9I5_CULPI
MTSVSDVFRDVRTMPASMSSSSPSVVLSGFARAWNIESLTSSTQLKFCPESVKHGNPIKFRFLSSSLSGCQRKRGEGGKKWFRIEQFILIKFPSNQLRTCHTREERQRVMKE